jgi:hypothetical protein
VWASSGGFAVVIAAVVIITCCNFYAVSHAAAARFGHIVCDAQSRAMVAACR